MCCLFQGCRGRTPETYIQQDAGYAAVGFGVGLVEFGVVVVQYFLITLQTLPFGMGISILCHFIFEVSSLFVILQRP